MTSKDECPFPELGQGKLGNILHDFINNISLENHNKYP
jgi:hypothetical protein